MGAPRVIVALDYPTVDAALAFADRVTPADCRLKVGLELFSAGGPAIVSELIKRGFDVFLDLKFHDIPNTVARACARSAQLGVWMLNVHVLGGRRMLAAAREAVDAGAHRPLLIGVTLLTSHDAADLADVGLAPDVGAGVERLAQLAHAARLDGVVASPRETAALRRRFGSGLLLVTPGIRPAGAAPDDQRRTLSVTGALAAGADFLVIGRPVTGAVNPRTALDAINREIGE